MRHLELATRHVLQAARFSDDFPIQMLTGQTEHHRFSGPGGSISPLNARDTAPSIISLR